MILDHLREAKRYVALHPGFARAFEYLATAPLAELPTGKHELDGQRLFAVISHAPGRGRSGAKLEIHRAYIDIQYVVRGTDEMGWRPLADCRQVDMPYDADREAGLFLDAPEAWIHVPAGRFTIFWPHDAHAPLGGEGELIKAVIKVAVDW